MSSRNRLPKSVREVGLFDNKRKCSELKTVYELAIEHKIIDLSIKPATLAAWSNLSDSSIRKIKNQECKELGLYLVFLVGIGAKYNEVKMIIREALGYDLDAPPLFDYDWAVRRACSIDETYIGERACCVLDELHKSGVNEQGINKYYNIYNY